MADMDTYEESRQYEGMPYRLSKPLENRGDYGYEYQSTSELQRIPQ